MIDCHTHLLPNFDDGSRDLEMSLAIIKTQMEQGITGAICTSHIEELTEENIQKLEESFTSFQQAVAQKFPNFKVYFGAEVSINAGILEKEHLLRRLTINKTGKYILIELPYFDIPIFFKEEIYNLCIHRFVPIIAHPERNVRIIKKPQLIEEFIEIGALTQCNTGSIVGVFGRHVRKTALYFLRNELVTVFGSDVHDLSRRALVWSKALKKVQKYISPEYLEDITYNNASKILSGEDIIV